MNIDYLDKELSKYPNALFHNNLSCGFRDGFLIGFEGLRISRFLLTTLNLFQNILFLLEKYPWAHGGAFFLTPFR